MYPEVGSWLIMILCTIGQSNSSTINNNPVSAGPFPGVRNHFNVIFFIINVVLSFSIYMERWIVKEMVEKPGFPGLFLHNWGNFAQIHTF